MTGLSRRLVAVRPAVKIDSVSNIHSFFTDENGGVGVNKMYFISNGTLTTDQLGGATSTITYIITARILHK